ncbi:MAG: biopolymer transporter ExbD [Ignavibacteriaceae bacterium]|nr:biopolymer transporter ExbD [Ignavibacteriaceae bacterium]
MAELDTSKGGGHKKGKKKRSKKASTRVDLTPMVDLAFLLVTFFMMTTTFSKPQTMEINMPVKPPPGSEQKDQSTKASQTMTIILGANDKVFWFKGTPDTANFSTTDYSPNGLRRILIDINKSTKDLTCIIKPTDKCNYRNVVDALDEMSIIGIKRYALVSDFAEDETNKIKNL